MSISRTGECPIFLKYITEQALIPRARQATPEFLALTRYNFHWIHVPTYQRGLVWSEELLEDLLGSRSIFLGNAILGSFAVDRQDPRFAGIPQSSATYEVLIDGLQRFSVGTGLLSILYPMVLSSTPERGDDAGFFIPLKLQIGMSAPVFLHNDYELANHSRKAVADSYSEFRRGLQRWVVGRFDAGEANAMADDVIRLFLQRQIAPDVFHGFGSVSDVAGTFIGLNTVRVQLNIVDWLRSEIIDKGEHARWNADEIERLENRFSEVFSKDRGIGPDAELVPLASILKEILTESGQEEMKRRIFPSWGPNFSVHEVDQLLDFVDEMCNYDANGFAREIRLAGAIPFAGLILFFYRRKLQEQYQASFLNGGTSDDAALLHFLRTYYRLAFEGRVAKTREYAKKLLLSNDPMEEVADQLSLNFIGKRLNETVDRDWLVAALKTADQRRARQVFNACLLPERDGDSSFQPHRYGRSSDDYQVDHMIPSSVIDANLPGGPEGQLLMNFVPIRKTTNVKQLNIPLSHKLDNGGVYQMECMQNDNTHPFLRWIVETQGGQQFGAQLDDQELLQTAAAGSLSHARIEWLADRLLSRL